VRVVLDTNVLLSALLTRGTAPDRLYEARSRSCAIRCRRSPFRPIRTMIFLLATAQAAEAELLVTGDKSGLLALKKHGVSSILAVQAFVDLLDRS
jgi:predicted nucleic acid-binding protein